MAATGGHVTQYKGQDGIIEVTLDPLVAGGIAGWTLQFNLSKGKGQTPILTLDNGMLGGVTIRDPVAEIIDVTLDDAFTDTLSFGTYVWDLWRIDPGSESCLCDDTMSVRAPTRTVFA
jgi:hypothetical protein